MKPTRCPVCQSDDLVHGPLTAHMGVLFHIDFLKDVGVSGAACLACGAVIPYLNDTALNTARVWSGRIKSREAVQSSRE